MVTTSNSCPYCRQPLVAVPWGNGFSLEAAVTARDAATGAYAASGSARTIEVVATLEDGESKTLSVVITKS